MQAPCGSHFLTMGSPPALNSGQNSHTLTAQKSGKNAKPARKSVSSSKWQIPEGVSADCGICVHVCVYACTCQHVHACVFVHLCAHACAHVWLCGVACVQTCKCDLQATATHRAELYQCRTEVDKVACLCAGALLHTGQLECSQALH